MNSLSTLSGVGLLTLILVPPIGATERGAPVASRHDATPPGAGATGPDRTARRPPLASPQTPPQQQQKSRAINLVPVPRVPPEKMTDRELDAWIETLRTLHQLYVDLLKSFSSAAMAMKAAAAAGGKPAKADLGPLPPEVQALYQHLLGKSFDPNNITADELVGVASAYLGPLLEIQGMLNEARQVRLDRSFTKPAPPGR